MGNPDHGSLLGELFQLALVLLGVPKVQVTFAMAPAF